MSQETAAVEATRLGEHVRDIEEADVLPLVDPNELHAADVARAMRDKEDQLRLAAEETARREADEQATRAVEAARRESAEREQAEAAARAVSAATAGTATPAPPAGTAVAESTVTHALSDATGSIQGAAAEAGWPAELLAKVERVVMCESSGRTTAVSPAGYIGLMQVAPWLHGPVPTDAVGQLAQAYGVYLRQGWGAWPVCGR